MTVPLFYRNPRGKAIVSYDFIDIASGKAYKAFYPMNANEAGSATKLLSPSIIDSQFTSLTKTNFAEDVFTLQQDHDYDIVFDVPKTIDGQSFIEITGAMTRFGTGAVTITSYFIIKIRKDDGSETDLVTIQGQDWAESVDTTWENKHFTFSLDIPKTDFAIGDTLRLTIEQWAKTGDAAKHGSVSYGVDPSNRNDDFFDPADEKAILDNFDTQIRFFVPFKIDVG